MPGGQHAQRTNLEDRIIAEVRLALGHVLPGDGAVVPALLLKFLIQIVLQPLLLLLQIPTYNTQTPFAPREAMPPAHAVQQSREAPGWSPP